jgi:hypothetical protein
VQGRHGKPVPVVKGKPVPTLTRLPVPAKFVDLTKSSDDETSKSAVQLLIEAHKDSMERMEKRLDVLQGKVVEHASTIAALEYQMADAYKQGRTFEINKWKEKGHVFFGPFEAGYVSDAGTE